MDSSIIYQNLNRSSISRHTHPIEPSESRHHPQSESELDLIAKLTPYPHVLEQIFSHLKPKYLRVLPCVSTSWRSAIYELTPVANRRRRKALRRLRNAKIQVGRENWPIDCQCAVYKRKLSETQDRTISSNNSNFSPTTALSSIQNTFSITRMLMVKKNGNLSQSHQSHQSPPSSCQQQQHSKRKWKLAQVPFKKW